MSRLTLYYARFNSSAVAVFGEEDSLELYQILVYEVSASDLVRQIKVTAVFGKKTKLIRYNVKYSIGVSGFDYELIDPNHIALSLYDLDASKNATIYFYTKQPVSAIKLDEVKPEAPNIHLEGVDKSGNPIYYVLPPD